MDFFKDLIIGYRKGKLENWTGRNSKLENQFWHQEIQVSSIQNTTTENTNIGLVGYICDEGVLRNQGRVGAKKGPKIVRNKLAKLPTHFTNKKVTDFGDIICIDNHLEDCQKGFSKIIGKLISENILPIAIGGGHDIAYANFNGIKLGLKKTSKKKIGIINFDAHFDLRTVETQSNSGTPFNQILSENKDVSYFAIGIQQQSNTKELFKIAQEKEVSFVSNFECETLDNNLKNKLNLFIDNVDYLYVTIDLDGFSSAFAPGVSAPSPLGFHPIFVYQALEFIFNSKKVISCDIAELNPNFDIDNQTANLAARLVDFIILNA